MADIEHICLMIDGTELSGVCLLDAQSGSAGDVRKWNFTAAQPDSKSTEEGVEKVADGQEPEADAGKEGNSLSKAFSAAASELKISSGAVLVLPSDILISRVISVPVADTDSISSMVRLQMEKLAPVSGDELEVAWEIVSADESSTRVFAVALPVSKLDYYANAISSSGIMLARIDSSILSQWELFKSSDISAGLLPQADGDVRAYLFQLPSGIFDFVIADSSGLIFARSLNRPATSDELVREVYLSLLDYAGENGEKIPSGLAYISNTEPDGAAVSALAGVAGTDVTWVDANKIGPYILGAVLRDNGDERIDIIPPAWRELEHEAETRGKFIRGIIAALAVWVVLFAAFIVVPKYYQKKIDAVEANIKRITPAYNAVSDIRTKVRIIGSYEDRSHSALEALRLICSEMPDGMTFSLLKYDKGFDDGKQKKLGGIKLSGDAPPGESVMQFKDALDKSGLFSQVTINSQQLDGKRQRERFELDARFSDSDGGAQ